MSDWHIWRIKQQRHKKVKSFLDGVDNVYEYIYPVVKQPFEIKNVKKVKTTPLYNNYIFIRCDYTNDLDVELQKCQWICDYIGQCSDEEMVIVKEMDGKCYEPDKHNIKPGMELRLRNTGFMITVEEVNGNTITASLEIFGLTKLIKCDVSEIISND